jgi:p-cumate 2,3-dioxygenase subunit beta
MSDGAETRTAVAAPRPDLISDVEQFLYEEAALLEEWELERWLELFTDDARYYVPATDLPEGDPRESLGLIDDDAPRLKGRVDRLLSAKAYREFPWSRTRHLVTNVRVVDSDETGVGVRASFLVYRFRKGEEQTFVGQYRYRLVHSDGGFRIAEKAVVLDEEALRPHGTLSIIL